MLFFLLCSEYHAIYSIFKQLRGLQVWPAQLRDIRHKVGLIDRLTWLHMRAMSGWVTEVAFIQMVHDRVPSRGMTFSLWRQFRQLKAFPHWLTRLIRGHVQLLVWLCYIITHRIHWPSAMPHWTPWQLEVSSSQCRLAEPWACPGPAGRISTALAPRLPLTSTRQLRLSSHQPQPHPSG